MKNIFPLVVIMIIFGFNDETMVTIRLSMLLQLMVT